MTKTGSFWHTSPSFVRCCCSFWHTSPFFDMLRTANPDSYSVYGTAWCSPPASPVLINRGTQNHYMVSKCTQTFIPCSILFHYEEKLQVHCSFNGTGQEKPWREVMETLDHQWEPRLRQESCLRKKDPVLVGLEGKCTQRVSA